ncbi:hypothetical protein LZC94_15845 [Pendulispora albinea]|uniref:Uncharacterized protein n=1 Tax=Pendulispora albinea TaxID=2741071 RepID=A0ABZ2M862_9BACT
MDPELGATRFDEGGTHRRRVGPAARYFELEGAVDQLTEWTRNLGGNLSKWPCLARSGANDYLVPRPTFMDVFAREKCEHRRADRPKIGAPIDVSPQSLFGRHERWRPPRVPRARDGGFRTRK